MPQHFSVAAFHPRIEEMPWWLQMNVLSAEIAKLKAVIRDRESSFPAGEVDRDDEELLQLRGQLRGLKDEYKLCHSSQSALAEAADTCAVQIEDARKNLLTAFEAWHEAEGAFLSEVLQLLMLQVYRR
jgi:hypothetical protein